MQTFCIVSRFHSIIKCIVVSNPTSHSVHSDSYNKLVVTLAEKHTADTSFIP